jgi:hypothetical protein
VTKIARRRALCLVVVSLLAMIAPAFARAADEMEPRLRPRLALLQLNYPQAVSVSAGAWLFLLDGSGGRFGPVGDLEAGLSGPTAKLGMGMSAHGDTPYERAWSFGVQAVVHRTWPWWTPWLASSTTFVGGEAFAAYFAFRCSVGALRPLRGEGSVVLTGGCGLGMP